MSVKVMKHIACGIWAKVNMTPGQLRARIKREMPVGWTVEGLFEGAPEIVVRREDGKVAGRWAITDSDLRHKSFEVGVREGGKP